MSVNDIYKPVGLIGAIGAAAAIGVAVGFAVARDPQLLRRFAGAAARGVGRAQLALAETAEEVVDMWEDLREQARRELEDARFEAAAGRGVQAAAGATASAAAGAAGGARAPGTAGAASASKGRAQRTRAKSRTVKAAGADVAAKRRSRKASPAAGAGDEAQTAGPRPSGQAGVRS